MKRADFHPKTKLAVQAFPKDIKLALGKAIFALQSGQTLGMPLSRPMSQVGKGVHEIRVKDPSGVYRVFYYTKVADAIALFHAFQKKTQKTSQKEIELGKQRLKEMLDSYE